MGVRPLNIMTRIEHHTRGPATLDVKGKLLPPGVLMSPPHCPRLHSTDNRPRLLGRDISPVIPTRLLELARLYSESTMSTQIKQLPGYRLTISYRLPEVDFRKSHELKEVDNLWTTR
ncbi:hypothetical protein J6590_002220 [Homalodisca vitripennis]|nr:hypothetical protein J6590_002220 [Homalodisca vitripennis]